MQGYIAHLMGKDGKPTLVSEEQFEKLKRQDGMVAIYRGFRRDEEKNIRDFKTGQNYYNGIGGAGEGSYFATQKLNTFSASGKYIEAVIDTKKAKIGDYQKLESQWLKSMRTNQEKIRKLRRESKSREEKDNYITISEVYDDFGRWATSMGYDAYVNHDDRFTEYIVLNRSILKVKR